MVQPVERAVYNPKKQIILMVEGRYQNINWKIFLKADFCVGWGGAYPSDGVANTPTLTLQIFGAK